MFPLQGPINGQVLFQKPEINSLASGIILATTLYRNQPGIGNKFGGAVGYAVALGVSVVESVAAAVFCALGALIYYPLSEVFLERSLKWLKSSSFCIVWSIGDFGLNLLIFRLVADEESARWIVRTGNIMAIPPGAVI